MNASKWNREQIHWWLKLLVPTLLILLLFLFWGGAIMSVLSPFLIGFLIAYMFNPVVTFIEGRNRKEYRMKRMMAVVVLYLGLILLGGVFTLILAKAVQEFILFGQRLPTYGANLYKLMEHSLLAQWDRLPPEFVEWVKTQLDQENLQKMFENQVLPRLQDANISGGVGTAVKGVTGFVQMAFGLIIAFLGKVVGSAGNMMTLISSTSLAVIIAFYLLLDYERFLRKISGLIPDDYREDVLRIMKRIDLQISGFLRGQITICICIGTLVSLGLWIIGVDYALLIGLGAGLFNIIPYLGPVMGAVPAVILTTLEEYQAQDTDWGHLAMRVGMVVGVFIAVQTLDGFLISPKIMGDRLDLHPMIILFALLLGGALMGFLGMLLAVPIACIVRVLIEEIYFPDPNRAIG